MDTSNIDVLLANHVEAPNGLLYVSGGGVDMFVFPENSVAPWGINVGLAISVKVPWLETDVDHELLVALIDFDGRSVQSRRPDGELQSIEAKIIFGAKRGPMVEEGADQILNLALNFGGLLIPALGNYTFIFFINSVEVSRVRFRAALQERRA